MLRNLNPRYEAQALIPAGTMLRAPKRVATLYTRNCVQGPRSQLAQQLVPRQQGRICRPAPPRSGAGGAGRSGRAERRRRRRSPRDYRVRPGDSLIAIAREHSCEVTVLAKENKLQVPGLHDQARAAPAD